MSYWDNIGSSVIGEGGQSGDAKNSVEVDWFSNNHDIFSGGRDTFLVDPRDIKRAETAPSVLTMYSADGTLCVGGSLEEEVPPEEEYRYTEEYHLLYYSKYPRDPRMLVPLRSCGGVRRAGEPGLPGRRGVTGNQKSSQEAGNATDSREATANNAQETEENAPDSPDKGTAYAKSVLDSLTKKQQKQQEEQQNRQRYEDVPSFSSMEVDATLSDTPMGGSVSPPATTGGCAQLQANKEAASNGGGQPPPASSPQLSRRGGGASRRGGQHSGPNASSGGARNNARRQANGGVLSSLRAPANELSSVREHLEEMNHECSYGAIQGRVVALSKDQEGSRFVQRLLEEEQNVASIFAEVLPSTCELMVHVFGNYVLQKLLDVLPAKSEMFKQLFEKVSGRLKEYSFHTYGCRVIQRFLVKASPEIRENILVELKDCIVDCVFDQNANHVAQKIIEVMPEKTQFMNEAFLPALKALSRHPYGCRVLQCVFEKCSPVPEVNIRPLLEAVLEHVHEYVMDQYGNYVVQHALLNAPEDLRKRFVEFLIPHVYALSCSKFASNVAEKTIVKANKDELQQIVDILTRPPGGAEDGSCLVLMMQDPYANYVVQRLLQEVNKQQQQHIAEQTRRHLSNIRRSVYGQHLVQKMENMGMFSWIEGEVCNNPVYHEQTAMGCVSNRKIRGPLGLRNGARGVSAPQSAYVTPIESSLATANSYRPPEASVAVAGRTVLPLATAGSGYSYGYLDSPSDTILAPTQQLQQAPHHLMSVPGVTIGVQPCYPGMMPPAPRSQVMHTQQRQYQPRQVFALQGQQESYNMLDSTSMPEHQQQIPQANQVTTTNAIYANAGAHVGQTPDNKWANTYQTLNTPVQQTMSCGVGAPNLYPSVDTAPAFWKWGCDPVLALSSSAGQQLRLI
ncbi:pumilio protein 2 [Trypanosoma conorhini]|uniref:Pumilio protein 2 n=1 Tax=Trypanosoma conorhini TaxID=83891 RepID=A0A3R7MIV5_9TRYP|nr:pumilio protein 2 [Trypanosoma conorhini]RNF03302.1 pumilio protein 2 [Trypanosoma conorhini]